MKSAVKEPEVVGSIFDADVFETEVKQEEAIAHRIQTTKFDMADAAQALEQVTKALELARTASIKATAAGDWVLFRQGDETFGMLCSSGADKVADYYGVRIKMLPQDEHGIFRPEKNTGEGGHLELTGYAMVHSTFNRRQEQIEATVRANEGFTGRQLDGEGKFVGKDGVAYEADLRLALMTRLRTKAVRVTAGMSRVPEDKLKDAGLDTAKCRKGHGFGSSTERNASRVAPEDVKKERKALGEEVLARVGGDIDNAKSLLKDITKGDKPGKDGKVFQGFDTVERLTKDWQVKNAWSKLRAHEVFGDDQQGREPGEEG